MIVTETPTAPIKTVTALAPLPDKAQSVVKPKPTKKEILEALVELRVQELNKQNADNQKKRDALKKKIHAIILKLFKKNFDKLAKVNWTGARSVNGKIEIQTGWGCPEVELEDTQGVIAYPPELIVMLNEYEALEVKYVSRKDIRNELQEKMNGKSTDRVAALVNHPASRKALTAMLNQITSVNVPTETKTIEA